MTTLTTGDLAHHLVATGLAGRVATSIQSCLTNCRRMVEGDPDTTFGLSDWRELDFAAVVTHLEACGVDLRREDPAGGEGPPAGAYVDPAAAVVAIERHRRVLAELAAGQARVLFATGHAFALLPHYGSLARALAQAGCRLLRPLDGERGGVRTPEGEPAAIRYFEGVASLTFHGALQHTHRSHYMEAMLEELGGSRGVDAVIGDHGFAGAAVEAGIATLSIADCNDPGLPVAQARGRTEGVLVIDDGLNPPVYEPVTAAMLDWEM